MRLRIYISSKSARSLSSVAGNRDSSSAFSVSPENRTQNGVILPYWTRSLAYFMWMFIFSTYYSLTFSANFTSLSQKACWSLDTTILAVMSPLINRQINGIFSNASTRCEIKSNSWDGNKSLQAVDKIQEKFTVEAVQKDAAIALLLAIPSRMAFSIIFRWDLLINMQKLLTLQ